MKKLLLCILSFGILIATPTRAETVLYCQNELATGIAKKNGSWETGSFPLSRYTIKFNDDFSRLNGLAFGTSECSAPFPSTKPDLLHCRSEYGLETFVYHKQKKRYTWFTMAIAYASEGSDTSSIEAGTCESF
jgi:hypothetical protein